MYCRTTIFWKNKFKVSFQQRGIFNSPSVVSESLKIHNNEKCVVFSMIQATGNMHIGNYLGAVKTWKKLIEENDTRVKHIYGVADLHSISLFRNPTELRENILRTLACLIASGIDEKKCILYLQSSVPEHAELNWYLSPMVQIGELYRMTQWKDKSNYDSSSNTTMENKKKNAALLCYPILQAADILLYKTTHVPVGHDQIQHIELCRIIAKKFNSVYNTNYFPEPSVITSNFYKILSLRNPKKKMSKSDENANSFLSLTDDISINAMKIRKAVTDSYGPPFKYDPKLRPGVSNLIGIVSALRSISILQTEAEIESFTNHEQLKTYTSQIVYEKLKTIKSYFDRLINNKDYLMLVLDKGRQNAREIALTHIEQIKTLIGLPHLNN